MRQLQRFVRLVTSAATTTATFKQFESAPLRLLHIQKFGGIKQRPADV